MFLVCDARGQVCHPLTFYSIYTLGIKRIKIGLPRALICRVKMSLITPTEQGIQAIAQWLEVKAIYHGREPNKHDGRNTWRKTEESQMKRMYMHHQCPRNPIVGEGECSAKE